MRPQRFVVSWYSEVKWCEHTVLRRGIYHLAKHSVFAGRISTMLMFTALCNARPGFGLSGSVARPAGGEPWAQYLSNARKWRFNDSIATSRCQYGRGHIPWRIAVDLRHAGQLAHHQKMFGVNGLLRKCHSHQDPGRYMGRGRSLEKGARRQGPDQC